MGLANAQVLRAGRDAREVTVLVAAVPEAAKVVACAVTTLVVAVARELAVRVPVVVKDVGVVALRAATAPDDGRVAALAARIRAQPIPRNFESRIMNRERMHEGESTPSLHSRFTTHHFTDLTLEMPPFSTSA